VTHASELKGAGKVRSSAFYEGAVTGSESRRRTHIDELADPFGRLKPLGAIGGAIGDRARMNLGKGKVMT